MGETIRIRREIDEDLPHIRYVNEKAFGGIQEADLIDALRRSGSDLVSLVAARGGRIVGHIQFSPATIEEQGRTVCGMGLAPMALLPDFQKQGIGSAMVRTGLEELKTRDCPFVIVLGHLEYYPRFGFVPASRLGIRS